MCIYNHKHINPNTKLMNLPLRRLVVCSVFEVRGDNEV